jgi:hypothetical protein
MTASAVTGSFKTYDATSNREDLTDAIYNISPTETPFISSIQRSNATATLHEWQTDALADATTDNALLEGFDVERATSSATSREQNYTQISGKNVTVSGTQRAVDHAAIEDMYAYQAAKKGRELKRDMETILTGNQGYTAGGSSTARTLRSLESWLGTNESRGSGGASATAATASATDATAGDQRTFTETILKDVIQQVYSTGGNANMLMVGPVNKQKVSDFTGRSSSREVVEAETILGAASLYASDFGDIRVVPNRFQRERTAFLIDPDMAAVSYLRPFTTFDLAKRGDADTKQILAEYTLEMRNEGAHGVMADLTTS